MTATVRIGGDAKQAVDALDATGKAAEDAARELDATGTAGRRAADGIDAAEQASEKATRTQRRMRQQVEDSSEALEEMAEQADKAARETEALGESSSGLSGVLGGGRGSLLATAGLAGAALGGATLALGAVRGAMDAAWESTERFFQAQSREDLWESVERSARGYTGTMFQLVIGTDDADEAHRRLVQILEDGLTVVRATTSALQPLADLLRGAVSGALSLAASAFGSTEQVISGFRDEVGGLVSDLEAYRQAMAETLAITDPTTQMWEQYTASVERLADVTAAATQNIVLLENGQRLSGSRTLDLLGSNAELAGQIREQLTPQIQDLIYTTGSLSEVNGRLTADVEYMGQRYQAVMPDVASALQRTAGAYDDLTAAEQRFVSVREQLLDTQEALNREIDLEPRTPRGPGGPAQGVPEGMAEAGAEAQRIAAQIDAMARDTAAAIADGVAKREAITLAAQMGKVREIEATAAAAAELERIEAESSARRLAIVEQTADATSAAFGRAATAAAMSLGAGAEQGADRSRRVFGGLAADLLDMGARTTFAFAGVTSIFDIFAGGLPNPGKAIAMAGAGATMKVASAFVRGVSGAPGGGGSGAPSVQTAAAASPMSSTSIDRSISTNVVNQFGVVGDARAVAGVVANSVRYAQREGML